MPGPVALRLLRRSVTLASIVVMCLVITPAVAYKTGEFPGIGNRQSWTRSNSIFLAGTKEAESAKYDAAIPKLQEAIAIYNLDPRYFYNLGLCFDERNKNGDMSRAEAAYRRAVQLNPENWKYWSGLAGPLYRQNKFAEAKAALRQSLSKGAPEKAIPILKESLQQIEREERSSK